MNLLFLIGLPLLTAIAVLLSRNKQQVKWISFAGSVAQLGFAFAFILSFINRKELAVMLPKCYLNRIMPLFPSLEY